jgi:hypothetical protein
MISGVFRALMFKSAFKLSRILPLIGFSLVCLRCVAQFDIDFSVAPALTPGLADSNPNTGLITTLSIDLLAPQRNFTYDVTGASILANSLDPSIRVDVYPAEGETDTGIRDSSQSGQFNPYGAGGSRLSTLFSGAGAAPRTGSAPPPASAVDQPATQASMDYGQPYSTDPPSSSATPTTSETASNDTYRSSWGSSSPTASSTSSSNWGSRPASGARSDVGSSPQPGGASSSPGSSPNSSLGSGYQSGSSLASAQSSASVDDPYRYQADPNIGWRSTGLARSRPTANGIPSGLTKQPTTFGRGSIDRFISRPGQIPGQIQDPYAPTVSSPGSQPASSGSKGESEGQQSFARDLTFTPRSDAAGSGDSSPFRSFGEGDFLQPNILDAGRISLPSKTGSSASGRRQSELGQSDQQKPLQTSASHYGLKSEKDLMTSPYRSSRGANGKRVNPYLAGDSSTATTRIH